MFVSDRMTREVITVDEGETVQTAIDRLGKHRIHQLPVVRDGDRLVGMVTDRDLRSVHTDEVRLGPVSEIMSTRLVTVSPGQPLEDALLQLHRHRFGALPVARPVGGAGEDAVLRLVGIITRTDILAALIDMLGIEQVGTRLEVELPHGNVGRVSDALQIVADSNAQVISIICSGKQGSEARRLYLRLATIDPRSAIDALTEAGFTIANPTCELM